MYQYPTISSHVCLLKSLEAQDQHVLKIEEAESAVAAVAAAATAAVSHNTG
jgi:hypothetical protein